MGFGLEEFLLLAEPLDLLLLDLGSMEEFPSAEVVLQRFPLSLELALQHIHGGVEVSGPCSSLNPATTFCRGSRRLVSSGSFEKLL